MEVKAAQHPSGRYKSGEGGPPHVGIKKDRGEIRPFLY